MSILRPNLEQGAWQPEFKNFSYLRTKYLKNLQWKTVVVQLDGVGRGRGATGGWCCNRRARKGRQQCANGKKRSQGQNAMCACVWVQCCVGSGKYAHQRKSPMPMLVCVYKCEWQNQQIARTKAKNVERYKKKTLNWSCFYNSPHSRVC